MNIKTLSVGPLDVNCYIVSVGKKTAVIDPGGDAEHIINYLEENDLEVEYVLNTHGHHDHILDNSELSKFSGKSVYIHSDDIYLLDADQGIFPTYRAEKDYPVCNLEDNSSLKLADLEIKVVHTPGHTKGSVCYLIENNLFCGDLLFKQSIGRTDLHGASPRNMLISLKKIMGLDINTIVYPGHGPSTTIEQEIKNNPYLLELNL